ncbi:lactonase family protein [Streptomyces sp. NPDC059134]|uniref:lactonase family protein n=1 Tax=Streptomyces sp. NPDC059134 TaxID=3346738 RepID=UPI0036C5A798
MTASPLARRTALSATAATVLALSLPSTARAAESLRSRREATPRFAYVGCYTTEQRNGHGKGISVFRADAPGRWRQLAVTATLPNPSFLALDHTRSHLYAVHGDLDQVSAFAIDEDTGLLTALGSQSSRGGNPVHLAVSPDNRQLLVANYATGTLAVLRRTAGGRLQPAHQVIELTGTPGPDRTQQTGPHPHHIPFTPDGRHVLVPDKGTDLVHGFAYAPRTGRLSATTPPTNTVRSGAGPRHIRFHPRLPVAYVVDELNSQVTTYDFDASSGGLVPRSWLPTLPPSFTGNSTAAEIQLTPDARFLYVSNRGHDSVVGFRADAAGSLHTLGWTPTGGAQPRFITVDPTGSTLHVANQASDTITAFHIGGDGSLQRIGRPVATGSPVCIVFRP